MKLSKVILVSFVALFITIVDVAVDTHDRTNVISTEQLTMKVESCLKGFSQKASVAYNNLKDDIRKANNSISMNNDKELAYNMQGQSHDFED